MTVASIGLRSDGLIDIDFHHKDEDDWNFNCLSLEEAEFVRDELTAAILRLKAKNPVKELPPKSLSMKELRESLLLALPESGYVMPVSELVSKYSNDPSGFGISNATAALQQLIEEGVFVLNNNGSVTRR